MRFAWTLKTITGQSNEDKKKDLPERQDESLLITPSAGSFGGDGHACELD